MKVGRVSHLSTSGKKYTLVLTLPFYNWKDYINHQTMVTKSKMINGILNKVNYCLNNGIRPQVLKDNPPIPFLESLLGFSKIFSVLVVLEIDDISRFLTEAKFASFCSLIPFTFASVGRYIMEINPYDNHWLKYVFVEASQETGEKVPSFLQIFCLNFALSQYRNFTKSFPVV